MTTRLEEAEALDGTASWLRDVVRRLPKGPVKDTLHGVPIGHPAHPALVQVPIGAWVCATVLDWVPRTGPAVAVLTGVGVATAAPAALAGAVDWADTHPEQQRVGVVHAACNVAAVALYSASLYERMRGRRLRGRALGLVGLAAVGVSGLLGGHMAYRQATGVNHAEELPHVVPPGWHSIGALADFPDGRPVRYDLDGTPLMVLREGSAVTVLADRCTHLSGPLSEGRIEDGCVRCPWHGSTFRLRDGSVVHGPATAPQPVFETRVVADAVAVRLPGAGEGPGSG